MSDELSLCRSDAMQSVRSVIAKVGCSTATVLLLGESGVGKEVAAHALHGAPPRGSRPFLKVDCALPEDLLELELFGDARGAFVRAQHGTLFLDEIDEMPVRLQARLLHVLQDGEFPRVGDERIAQRDVRVVAATSHHLEAAVRVRRFRADLFYRLNVVAIRIPPLRERREEIGALAGHFLRRFNALYCRSVVISAGMMLALTDYAWPGNIRELENAVKRLVVLGSSPVAHRERVSSRVAGIVSPPAPSGAMPAPIPADPWPSSLKTIGREAARAAERVVITAVLDRVHWNRAKAARLLQISSVALRYKMIDYGLAGQDPKVRQLAGTDRHDAPTAPPVRGVDRR